MRSRFTAFAVGNVEYLLASWDPATRPASLELDDDLDWRQLEIHEVVTGGPEAELGIVEFVAYYREPSTGQFGQQRERSAFRRTDGQWYYVGLAD